MEGISSGHSEGAQCDLKYAFLLAELSILSVLCGWKFVKDASGWRAVRDVKIRGYLILIGICLLKYDLKTFPRRCKPDDCGRNMTWRGA